MSYLYEASIGSVYYPQLCIYILILSFFSTDLKFQKSSLSKIWTVSDDKFAKVVDLQAQIVESVGELDEEIFWIEELTDRNSWLLGTPNVINLCDDRMKNITNLIPKTNGVKSVVSVTQFSRENKEKTQLKLFANLPHFDSYLFICS